MKIYSSGYCHGISPWFPWLSIRQNYTKSYNPHCFASRFDFFNNQKSYGRHVLNREITLLSRQITADGSGGVAAGGYAAYHERCSRGNVSGSKDLVDACGVGEWIDLDIATAIFLDT